MKRSHSRNSSLRIQPPLIRMRGGCIRRLKKITSRYFGSQIENNMLEITQIKEKWFSSFHYFFFTLLQWARRSSAPDYSTNPKKTTSCIALCLCCFCFAGTSASAYRVGSSKASVLVWKLAQFKCFEHVLKRTFGLQGKHSILFARLLFLLSSSFDTRTCTQEKQQRFRCFSSKMWCN